MTEVWSFVQQKLESSLRVILLYVFESEGSSPGRKGFKMAVSADGDFCGTIGGGIMEYKMVENAKSMLKQAEPKPLLMRQYHDKGHVSNQSGMICSGSQLNAFIPVYIEYLPLIKNIVSCIEAGKSGTVILSPGGIIFKEAPAGGFEYHSKESWQYSEALNQKPVIHIIGAGHIGLALSELMRYLGFYVKLYDDRPDLNTLAANSFAHEKHIVDYEKIASQFENAEHEYAVIMTIGYRTDKTVLLQLLEKNFNYLGLLGSKNKVETLYEEMKAEGIAETLLEKVHAPVGLHISSQTTQEIAVSIAAEIIMKKNERHV